MTWKENLSVDVVSIDTQHKDLINAVSGFFARIHTPMPKTQLLDELDGVIALVGAHFQHEERVMRNINLPSLAIHKQLHRALLDEISEFREEVAMGGALRGPDDIERFLNLWLYRHIVEEDQNIAAHLHQ